MEKSKAFNWDVSNASTTDYFVGIDLGTTNSVISIVGGNLGDKPKVLKLSSGKTTLPSCVMLDNGEYIVGDKAYEHRGEKFVINSIKRHMGENYEAEIMDKTTGEKRTLTSEFVSSLILKKLMDEAKVYYPDVKKAVITVPAYFTTDQKKATEKAGILAGIEVVELIQEPSSSALAYTLNKLHRDSIKTLVYDLGGGTFDANIAQIVKVSKEAEEDVLAAFGLDGEVDSNDRISVTIKESAGDNHLGGDDLDEYVYSEVLDANPENYEAIENEKLRLVSYIERFKRSITNDKQRLTYPLSNGEQIVITVDMFEKATKKIFSRTMEVLSKINTKDIDGIILVGGSTYSVHLRKMLAHEFEGVNIFDGVNPDEIVSVGAALRNAIKQGVTENFEFNDILSMSIGIEDENGTVEKILMKSESLPAKGKMRFRVVNDGQVKARFNVCQGESRLASECTQLGTLLVDNLVADSMGVKAFTVTLLVNTSGILTIEVTHNGNTYKKELINIKKTLDTGNAPSKGKMKINEKRVAIWRTSATPEINALIDRYVEGEEELKDEIVKLIKLNQKVVNDAALESAAKSLASGNATSIEDQVGKPQDVASIPIGVNK